MFRFMNCCGTALLILAAGVPPAQANPRMAVAPSPTFAWSSGAVMVDFTGIPSITSSSAGLGAERLKPLANPAQKPVQGRGTIEPRFTRGAESMRLVWLIRLTEGWSMSR